jgi:hypothetical protein
VGEEAAGAAGGALARDGGGGAGAAEDANEEQAAPEEPAPVGPSRPAAIDPSVLAFMPSSLRAKRAPPPGKAKAARLMNPAPGPRRPAHATVPLHTTDAGDGPHFGGGEVSYVVPAGSGDGAGQGSGAAPGAPVQGSQLVAPAPPPGPANADFALFLSEVAALGAFDAGQ